tara:strand:- start:3865 stop:5775 length:1911 start_codon:yes stop_codon:yes gene_type:complete
MPKEGYCTPNNNNYVFYPGTNIPVTRSYDDRLTKQAEFDDALMDQASWRNSRYDGSKLSAKKINKYSFIDSEINTTDTSSGEYEGKYVQIEGGNYAWGGDTSYQNLPVVNRLTTALYIANTVVGGEENDNYVTLKNHSYVGISQILLVNLIDDSVQLIDKTTFPYQDFHRFITTDFPTGNSCAVKVIEDQNESVPNNLQGIHKVKMNKGYLLKTFTYKHAGESSGSEAEIKAQGHEDVLTENNAMYLYTYDGTVSKYFDNTWLTGSQVTSPTGIIPKRQLRFRYANFSAYEGLANGQGTTFNMRNIGPKFDSSSIHENRFTQQFYSGSYGIIGGSHSSSGVSIYPSDIMLSSSWGRTSKFVAIDCLSFLQENNARTDITQREKTELHVTFFQGTKDFTKGVTESISKEDERSIGTFEVDQNLGNLMIEQGDVCNGGLPVNHELIFKGPQDNRFMPTINAWSESIQSGHMQNVSASSAGATDGCTAVTHSIKADEKLQSGITIDIADNITYYVQGGALGPNGKYGDITSSTPIGGNPYIHYRNGALPKPRYTSDNAYSGSFHYELSFLDKDHTLILNINKNTELPDGIGDKGIIIVPQDSHPQVALNIDYYLQKAGIANTGISIPQNLTNETNQNIT